MKLMVVIRLFELKMMVATRPIETDGDIVVVPPALVSVPYPSPSEKGTALQILRTLI